MTQTHTPVQAAPKLGKGDANIASSESSTKGSFKKVGEPVVIYDNANGVDNKAFESKIFPPFISFIVW